MAKRIKRFSYVRKGGRPLMHVLHNLTKNVIDGDKTDCGLIVGPDDWSVVGINRRGLTRCKNCQR